MMRYFKQIISEIIELIFFFKESVLKALRNTLVKIASLRCNEMEHLRTLVAP